MSNFLGAIGKLDFFAIALSSWFCNITEIALSALSLVLKAFVRAFVVSGGLFSCRGLRVGLKG
jgi:hypothetical protein